MESGTILQNRYRILARVGGGGMGTVYQAEDLRLANHLNAIKAFSPANVPQGDRTWALSYFRQEAEILAKLNHPGLARVSNFFNEADMWFLVMDWVDGVTLSKRLHETARGLSIQESVAIVDQLCDVLEYLHNQQPPVIFRDLKPSNIMINQQGQVKLIDFGTARFFKPDQSRDTVNLGTPGYAAPEQYGGIGQSDARADIYSLGVVLHELLTGHNPTITPFRLPPISTLNPIVPPHLERTIQKATSMETSDRYQTIADMKKALHQPDTAVTTQFGQFTPFTELQQTTQMPSTPYSPVAEPYQPFRNDPITDQFPPSTYTQPTEVKKKVPMWLIFALLGVGVVICGIAAVFIWRFVNSRQIPTTPEWIPTNTPLIAEKSSTPPPDTPTPTLTPTSEPPPPPSPTVNDAIRENDLLKTIVYRPDNGIVIFAYQTGSAPIIDGSLNEWDSKIYAVPYNIYDPDNTWTGPSDLSGEFQISWDANNLYLAAQVIDDVHAQNETGETIFKGDDVDIQIDSDLTGDFSSDELNGDDGQIGLSPGNFQNRSPEAYVWLPSQREGLHAGINMASMQTPQGYIVEAAIPWLALGGRPTLEMPVGFNINISDNDDINNSIQQVMLSTSPNRTWSNPQTWGTLIIVDW